MGAVSFQDVEPLAFDNVYFHDYHGWRDTMADVSEAFNAYTAQGGADGIETLQAVSFFTAADNVTYTVKVYDRFEGGELLDELASQAGTIEYSGFHTIDLDTPLELTNGDDFYIYVQFSDGGHPYDRTSDVPVLLGASYRTIVKSAANPGESYYLTRRGWEDLYDYDFTDPTWDGTANFCIKGLSTQVPYLTINLPDGLPEYLEPGEETSITVQILDGAESYVPGTGMINYRYDGGDYLASPLVDLGDDLYEATLPAAHCDDVPEYYFSAEGDGSTVVCSPADAPDTVYTAIVGTLTTVVEDHFETDLGWTVENIDLQAGPWERAVPVGSGGGRGDPPNDYDGSGKCYVTGNGYDEDIDGGPTRLISPTFDLADMPEAYVNYARWFYNDDNDTDRLLCEVSNDNGANWVTLENVSDDPGWKVMSFRIADFVAPNDQIKFRFSADDNPNDSVTEAGLDDFRITFFSCEDTCPADVNYDGVVDIDDLFQILGAWGTCDDCPEDVNDDGKVDIDDIFAVLAAWGPCP